MFARGERLRHHLIFYLGHTATFFINKLVTGGFLDNSQRLDPHFESIFAVGVDEMSWDDILEDNYDWNYAQTDEEIDAYFGRVIDYRLKVVKFVCKWIDDNPIKVAVPITQDSMQWVLLMAIEHEKIHFETSAVIMQQLPLRFVE